MNYASFEKIVNDYPNCYKMKCPMQIDECVKKYNKEVKTNYIKMLEHILSNDKSTLENLCDGLAKTGKTGQTVKLIVRNDRYPLINEFKDILSDNDGSYLKVIKYTSVSNLICIPCSKVYTL